MSEDFSFTSVFFIDAINEWGEILFWNCKSKLWEENYRGDTAYVGEFDIMTLREAEEEFDIASISPKKVPESIVMRLNQATFGEKTKLIRSLKK